ncbi:MAG: hypothetical protein QOI80_349, partial [Solirubrobacteraceae bacterium]|nr:hypothetical protein [Solirubrobacteraceae bacterium]
RRRCPTTRTAGSYDAGGITSSAQAPAAASSAGVP